MLQLTRRHGATPAVVLAALGAVGTTQGETQRETPVGAPNPGSDAGAKAING